MRTTGNMAVRWRRCCAPVAFLAFVIFFPLFTWGEELRLRIAWGGGRERQWHGVATLSEGRLAELQTLGIEADEPASMYLEQTGRMDQQRLLIKQRSNRAYDGFDVLITAPLAARLTIQLTPADAPERPCSVEIPLADVVQDYVNKDLDGQGNRLLATRAPGDQLRVELTRDSLVFAPGERFRFTVEPHLLALAEGTKVRLKVQLYPAGGTKELWTSQHEVQVGAGAALPLEVTLPDEEGAYDVVLSVISNPGWSEAVRRPLSWNKILVERKVQVLVMDQRSPQANARSQRDFSSVVEIDPANPHWWELLNKLPQLPQLQLPKSWRLGKGPLGNGNLKPYAHSLGSLVQLNPNVDSPDVSWEAYWLPISQPGRPHILEVEYPSNVPQTLGISILEPNAAGALAPVGLDSGIDVREEVIETGEAPRMLRHRLIFWPRSSAPLVLMTNGRDRVPAVYGKIRVLAGGERLPRAAPLTSRQSQRLLAAYFDRPLFPENFSAPEVYDEWCGRALDDWNTFYAGGSRLVEYLQHVGYNGLMLNVLADGSTIYPSALAAPTPRYDTGVFFATGQDPVRKDVLEMLFRMFDREKLQLIPSLEYAAPLPELEAIRRRGGADAEALEWIGAEGKSWRAVHSSERGLAPYYNVLNPRVQEAMFRVFAEVAERYAQHPSFAGMAVRLAADGYAQLPGEDWGLDDQTIAQFEQDTKIRVPGEGPRRFAARAAFLGQEAQQRAWLEWRAARLNKFYARAQELLVSLRSDSRLYLAGAEMIAGPAAEAELKPSLSRRTTLADLLLRRGFDARHYQSAGQLVFLRPERLISGDGPAAKTLELQIGQTPDNDTYFQGLSVPGSLFFHVPRDAHIPSFDQQSPIKPSNTWLVLQPAQSGAENRRRFVHSLAALDAQVLCDGGWQLSLGQEEALGDLAVTYRSLPAVRFQQVTDRRTSSQPVTFRVATYGNRTYLYAVNDAPFPASARINVKVRADCRIEELSGLRRIAPLRSDTNNETYWEVRLEPFDLVAARLSEPNIQVALPQAILPKTIAPALAAEINQLGARAAALRMPPSLAGLRNSDFEKPADRHTEIPDWQATSREGVTIQLDATRAHNGRQSVCLASNGPPACLVSRPLPTPTTGRVSMSVWLCVADPQQQPPLQLALEGKLGGQDYYCFAAVGRMPNGSSSDVKLGAQWAQYIFQVDDLPLQGLCGLRARFDLTGPGEVWIDDVQMFDLAFSRAEMVELSKIISLADVKLQSGQISDCLQLLEGYWPRFLEENVPLPTDARLLKSKGELAEQPGAKSPESGPQPTQNSDRTGLFDRVKSLLPEKLRF